MPGGVHIGCAASVCLGLPALSKADPSLRCRSQEYAEVVAEGREHVLLDVRKEVQFAVCALDKAVNVPLSRLEVNTSRLSARPLYIPLFHKRLLFSALFLVFVESCSQLNIQQFFRLLLLPHTWQSLRVDHVCSAHGGQV